MCFHFIRFNKNSFSRYPNMNRHLYGTHQVEHLYITDDDSNKKLPRRDYIPNFESRTSRRPKLQQELRSRALAAATSSRGRFDDLEVEDDDEDDTPAFDFKGFKFTQTLNSHDTHIYNRQVNTKFNFK